MKRKRSRPNQYTKVEDARKRDIRGLWKRNDRFYARLTIEDDFGRKTVKWMPLEKAATVPEAVEALADLKAQRKDNRLAFVGQAPKLADYLNTYKGHLLATGKKPRTIASEEGHLDRWSDVLGGIRLDKIRPHHITAHLDAIVKGNPKANEKPVTGRTRNYALVCLRNLLKKARTDGHLKALPVDGIPWAKHTPRRRQFYSADDIGRIVASATEVTKNAQQLADFIRLCQYSGAREQEVLAVRWADVNFKNGFVTIGAGGDTKNRETRHVDFNSKLEVHLRDMRTRRQQDSSWLFPSPQRGMKDEHAKTLRESMKLARQKAGFPRFGFHDLRHHFASVGVMAGIDFMTIARWLGHKDGGILVGRVYGHLANDHRKKMARALNFDPVVLNGNPEKDQNDRPQEEKNCTQAAGA